MPQTQQRGERSPQAKHALKPAPKANLLKHPPPLQASLLPDYGPDHIPQSRPSSDVGIAAKPAPRSLRSGLGNKIATSLVEDPTNVQPAPVETSKGYRFTNILPQPTAGAPRHASVLSDHGPDTTMGMMQIMDQEDQNMPAHSYLGPQEVDQKMPARSYVGPQEVEMQTMNASSQASPSATSMAKLKGNRFQHGLGRAKARQDDAEEDRKPSAIPEDAEYIHAESVASKPTDDVGDAKGDRNLYRRRTPNIEQQHAKKGMDAEARSAASRVGSYYVDASMEEFVGAYRVKGSQITEADARGSVLDKSFKSSEAGSSKQLHASPQSRSSSAGGLVAAEAIESEVIVYAEASQDTSKRNFRLISLLGGMAVATILIGILVPYFHSRQDGDGEFVDPRCLLSVEDQNVIAHCLCRGSTTELLPFLSEEELDTYDRLVGVYKEQHLLSPNKTLDKESCMHDNQAILWISNYRRLGVEDDDLRLREIPFISEVYVVVSLYLAMGGELWAENSGWLSTINICDWFGIE